MHGLHGGAAPVAAQAVDHLGRDVGEALLRERDHLRRIEGRAGRRFDHEDRRGEVGGFEQLLRFHHGEESEGGAKLPGGVVA